MNYSKIKNYDIANGPGLRVSVWYCGCPIHCEGCFNSELWDFDSGTPWDETAENEAIELLKDPKIEGLSVLGGEPLMQDTTLRDFLERARKEVNKNVWLWTGFDILKFPLTPLQKDILKLCDVVVDGPYIESLNKSTHRFRGSTNQRIFKVLGERFEEITEEIDKNEYVHMIDVYKNLNNSI